MTRLHYCIKQELIRKENEKIFEEIVRKDLENSKEIPGDKYWQAITTLREYDDI